MRKYRKLEKPGRAEVIKATMDKALVEGKGTGNYTCPTIGLKERFTYVKVDGKLELAEVWTNAEEVYPPFTDRKGRRIRY